MILSDKKRGRPVGSRNRESRPSHQRVPGSASSAASTGARAGVAERVGLWVYVPGEGFVRWSEIMRQVEEAHGQWRRKKSLQGVRIMDGWEWRQEHIEAAVAQRRALRAAAHEEAALRKLTAHSMDSSEAQELGVFVGAGSEEAA